MRLKVWLLVMVGVLIVLFGFLFLVISTPFQKTNLVGIFLLFIGIVLVILRRFLVHFPFTPKNLHRQRVNQISLLSMQSPTVKEASREKEAYLEATKGALAGKKIPISMDDFSIGRLRSNNLQIPDVSVSRQHVRLRYGQSSWFIQDQGSRTGVFLNGDLVQAMRLNSGDRITIGDNEFIFHA